MGREAGKPAVSAAAGTVIRADPMVVGSRINAIEHRGDRVVLLKEVCRSGRLKKLVVIYVTMVGKGGYACCRIGGDVFVLVSYPFKAVCIMLV